MIEIREELTARILLLIGGAIGCVVLIYFLFMHADLTFGAYGNYPTGW